MATKKTGASGKTAPLDPKVAGKLLDKLGTDNEFRRLFKKDPAAALVKAGHPKDTAASVAACCQVQRIAPKAQIVKAREELKTMFASGLSQGPLHLDANNPISGNKK